MNISKMKSDKFMGISLKMVHWLTVCGPVTFGRDFQPARLSIPSTLCCYHSAIQKKRFELEISINNISNRTKMESNPKMDRENDQKKPNRSKEESKKINNIFNAINLKRKCDDARSNRVLIMKYLT